MKITRRAVGGLGFIPFPGFNLFEQVHICLFCFCFVFYLLTINDGVFLPLSLVFPFVSDGQHAFPGVPIEMIVSLGTGCFFEEKKEFMEPTLGWDGIINQVRGGRVW